MSFHWVGEGTRPYRSQDFPTRVDAEAWVTDAYVDLLEDGVSAITLYEDGSVVYGPMSLSTP